MKTDSIRHVLFSRNAITISIVCGCVLVLLGLLIPAIGEARDSARRTQSRNNLKQLALGFHNYHDVCTRFPIGADIDPSGTAKHGWIVRTFPYLEASDLYSRIDMNEPWDHHINGHLFQRNVSSLTNPRLPERYSWEGFGLTNYEANPNVVFRNGSISFDDMSTGNANHWLLGEVAADLKPWAYPFNWRPLTWPLNSVIGGYGDGKDGVQIAMADGSVRALSGETDSAIVRALAAAPPVAHPDSIRLPDRHFILLSEPLDIDVYDIDAEFPGQKKHPRTTIVYDRVGNAHTADVQLVRDGQALRNSHDPTIRVDLPGIVERYPSLRVLILRDGDLDDSTVSSVFVLRDLETLGIDRIQVSDELLKELASLPRLSYLSGAATDEMARKLRQTLPNCRLGLSPLTDDTGAASGSLRLVQVPLGRGSGDE